jgi:hypothetical protein
MSTGWCDELKSRTICYSTSCLGANLREIIQLSSQQPTTAFLTIAETKAQDFPATTKD